MNAPRQGLYATIIAISFALHTALIVEGAAHQLASTRDAQGQLLIRQLAEDASLGVARQDTVALALLANRYSQRPDVVSMRLLAADGHILATGGNAPSRSGASFQQILFQDRAQSGQVELTLADISLGEIIRLQWLPLLLSLLIHAFLWLFYRVVARPKPLWAADTHAADHFEESESGNSTIEGTSDTTPTTEPSLQLKAAEATSATPKVYPVVLKITFDDPKSLLDTLTPSIAQKYFNLCQKLLEEAIRVLGTHMPNDGESTELTVITPFGMNGALVGVSQSSTPTLGHLLLLAQLVNLLSDAVYRRNRLEKRFALHTHTVISEAHEESDAITQSAILVQHAKTNDVLIKVSDSNLSRLMIQFSLSALEQAVDLPENSEIGEIMRLNGLRSDQAQLIERTRAQILG
ncbi:MAG: hypothetical protein H7Z73_06520 [Candidatus Saccharibacteria bacterium]|nr:hypothetical protein [Moraxellaceae bacterium]